MSCERPLLLVAQEELQTIEINLRPEPEDAVLSRREHGPHCFERLSCAARPDLQVE